MKCQYGALIFFILFFFSCKIKKESPTQNNSQVKNTVLDFKNTEFCRDDATSIIWKRYDKLIPIEGKDFSEDNCAMFTADHVTMYEYFLSKLKSGESIIFSIPMPMNNNYHCVSFTLSDAGVMDPVLAEKYKNILSLKGNALENDLTTIRAEISETKALSAYVNNGNDVYIVEPYKINNEYVYVVYNKLIAPNPKKSFEE